MAKSALKYKNIAIIHRHDKKEASQFSKKVALWLKKKGLTPCSPADLYIENTKKISSPEDFDNIQLVIVLGGDGTYLNAVRRVQGRNIPILGANFGQIGFLTESESKELFARLELVFAGQLTSVKRFLLDVKVLEGKKTIYSDLSLNDVVVERGANTHLIEMEVHCDESLVSRFRGDGIILSTAIGSTAYNLSAGGPIIHPEVSALAVTPVCPHSLTARPIILADHHKITVSLIRDQKATLMVDGAFAIELGPKLKVIIEKSKKVHHLIPAQVDYFELLNRKLEFGQRG